TAGWRFGSVMLRKTQAPVMASDSSRGPLVRHVRLLPGAHAAVDEEHLAVHVPGVVAAEIDGAAAADVATRDLATGRVQLHPAAEAVVAVDDRGEWRADEAGGEAVDADVVRGERDAQ